MIIDLESSQSSLLISTNYRKAQKTYKLLHSSLLEITLENDSITFIAYLHQNFLFSLLDLSDFPEELRNLGGLSQIFRSLLCLRDQAFDLSPENKLIIQMAIDKKSKFFQFSFQSFGKTKANKDAQKLAVSHFASIQNEQKNALMNQIYQRKLNIANLQKEKF